ncbi:hypothetical protein K4F52_006036 [Lecanicillium sp. MT-2017a]|nr:hypothetical protein K4F52_006036 [Lecanicillium sp. MT-2017a]
MHQDVAARNLVIDEQGNLRIFDFNYAIMIDKHYTPHRDDTKGVIFTLYEIITLDEHFREVPHEEQDAEALLQMEWTRHPDVQLDCEVDALRAVLDAWVAERKKRTFQRVDTWIEWPWMPEPPLGPVLIKDSNAVATGKEIKAVPVLVRRHLVSLGEPFYNWERPASHRVREGVAAADAATPGSSHEEER